MKRTRGWTSEELVDLIARFDNRPTSLTANRFFRNENYRYFGYERFTELAKEYRGVKAEHIDKLWEYDSLNKKLKPLENFQSFVQKELMPLIQFKSTRQKLAYQFRKDYGNATPLNKTTELFNVTIADKKSEKLYQNNQKIAKWIVAIKSTSPYLTFYEVNDQLTSILKENKNIDISDAKNEKIYNELGFTDIINLPE